MSASDFAVRKHELPDGGRWHELHDGVPVMMQPPDDDHGNAVLNLSRELANWFAQRNSDESQVGYACHEIGLRVQSGPDTVYCPAISYFRSGNQFAETDNVVAENMPDLVIDIASTSDRRQEMRRRTMAYVGMGVKCVWVPDPMKKEVQIITPGAHTLALAGRQTIQSDHVLPGFQMTVSQVFVQPEWWR